MRKVTILRLIERDPVARFLCHRVLIKSLMIRARLMPVKPVRVIKKYLITLTALPASLAVAERCIESAKRYGEDGNLEIMPAIDRNEARYFFAQRGLEKSYLELIRRKSPRGPAVDSLAVAGCLASHFKLWERCVELGQPIIVLEHDAMFRAPLPALRFKHVITLCTLQTFVSRSHRRVLRALGWFEDKEIASLWGSLPGGAAYAIKPEGARRLIAAAHREPLLNLDSFVNRRLVEILYYHPSPLATDKTLSVLAPPA